MRRLLGWLSGAALLGALGMFGPTESRHPLVGNPELLAPTPNAARGLVAAPGLAPATRPASEVALLGGTCLNCHGGIEDIHPGYKLSCVECHGGDDTATTQDLAHVLPRNRPPGDERVLPETYDLEWQRFKNPSNLRVAEQVCGDCHRETVDHVHKSLHATTTGHLGDGFYENGLTRSKRPQYSIFAVQDDDGEIPEHALSSTLPIPAHRDAQGEDDIGAHFSDLPRKNCMQCHLYSEGRAVDGRVGLDGDYRGEGCAACHVTYHEDGRSRSGDPSIDKLEPGHPAKHRFTSRIPTATCTSCHYGDASIGLHFRGLAQLVPGMPAGPEVPGTTDKLLNGMFYIDDPALTPPDVHHEAGMHCIDCHTARDTMGDGNLYPQMDFAVEIECTSCHGTVDKVSDLTTSRGRRVTNLERRGEDFFLMSKVTGKRHRVTQVKHVVDPDRPEYSERGAQAMTSDHARLECYTCHNGWNVNFFGFHFDRNEQFKQLDLISGERTPGRVTTQEKVFATFNQLRLGFNHEGMIAPYMVGFSTIGSVHDENGDTQLHQGMPRTKEGLSGVTLVPHQTHTTRPEARDCVECHRSPTTWGLGSPNFRLTRSFGYAVASAGSEQGSFVSVALDGKTLQRTQPVAELPLPAVPRAVALKSSVVDGASEYAYVACEDGRLIVVDTKSPVMPQAVGESQPLADPRRLLVSGQYLYAADGAGGVVIFDLHRPDKPKPVGYLPTIEARALQLQWPWLVVADGPGGLVVADVSDPEKPEFVAEVDLNQESSAPNDAWDVALLFQYSRFKSLDEDGIALERSPARLMAYVACGLDGVRAVDLSVPEKPLMLAVRSYSRVLGGNRGDVRGVAINTQFDIGSAGGGLESTERDYLLASVINGRDDNRQQRMRAVDVSDPMTPRRAKGNPRIYGGSGRLMMFRAYNAPFLQQFAVAVGAGGLGTAVNISRMEVGAEVAATWDDLRGVRDFAMEEFAFDRLQDEQGNWEKDISHENCRYLTPEEILRVLRADIPVEQGATGRYGGTRETNRRRNRNR